ncbi:hypothetical protein [Fischerella thermalis]|uniref:hypothetical protein n=1 Tax=Fischerella thermalis TaxID=372787 RepID=UPI001A029157|nr:hypothetical protein [Fischerella thermalis]MBF2068659.1 hypothetical protein [Fischerella thermalis M48_A2018_028]
MLWQKAFSTRFQILFSITLAIALCINWMPNLWKYSTEATVDLQQLYSRSAQYHGPERNPVIVIPGLIGSVLSNLKKEPVWGKFSINSDFTRIAIPLQTQLATSQETLKADEILPGFKVNIFGWRFEQDVYRQILEALGTIGGYRDSIIGKSHKVNYKDDHFTCFQFPYDWWCMECDRPATLLSLYVMLATFIAMEDTGVSDSLFSALRK